MCRIALIVLTSLLVCACARSSDDGAKDGGRDEKTVASAPTTARTASPRRTAAPRAGNDASIAAVVNGHAIPTAELDARLAADAELSDDVAGATPDVVYAAKRLILERMIDDILLDEEASRRGTSREALVAQLTKAVSVTDGEIDAAYATAKDYKGSDVLLARRNKRLFAGSQTDTRARIRAFMIREKNRLAIRSVTGPLRKDAHIELKLAKPEKAVAS